MRIFFFFLAALESLEHGVLIFFYFIYFGHATRHVVCGILVSQLGVESVPPAVEARSLHHWTTREIP